MRIAGGAADRREKFSPHELELSAILFEWDPIRLTAMGAMHVDDEYDDLVRPILAELGRGVHPGSLSLKLATCLRRDYGLKIRPRDTRAVAQRITEWWRRTHAKPPQQA